MANTGLKEPSRPTVKRLFALSGNRCAFPKCSTPLVDQQSGAIVGEVCHIKGEKPESARYDSSQPDDKRHSFDNLVLFCNVHHKVVDDDDVAYTVERLAQMKKDHEGRNGGALAVDDATAERFVSCAITNSTIHGSVVTSYGQSGGQTAHIINNNYLSQQSEEEAVRLEANLESACGLDVLAAFGCPGLRLSIICRSVRPAKIQLVSLCITGVNVMAGIQKGFGSDFGYIPVEGVKETFLATLIPMSPPNASDGYILNRDDVSRFFYPLPLPSTTLILQAKPEDVSAEITFFDGSEQTVLSGQVIQNTLQSVFDMFHQRPGVFRGTIQFRVRGQSKTPPTPDMIGKVNANYLPFAESGPTTSLGSKG